MAFVVGYAQRCNPEPALQNIHVRGNVGFIGISTEQPDGLNQAIGLLEGAGFQVTNVISVHHTDIQTRDGAL